MRLVNLGTVAIDADKILHLEYVQPYKDIRPGYTIIVLREVKGDGFGYTSHYRVSVDLPLDEVIRLCAKP